MLTPTTHIEKPANLVAFAFLLIAFLTGIASSFQLPTLSLFLSQEIQVSPAMVGYFYAINAIIGIGLSQILAKYSDKMDDRRKVMLFCCMLAIGGCLVFAFSRDYLWLVLFGTTLLGLGSSANPQSFALAREYADSTGKETVMFSTIMRTQISLAWIVGPPLSFSIALNWGFDWMYSIAALAFLFCGIIAITLLPKVPHKKMEQNTLLQAPVNNRKSVIYLFVTVFMIFNCNGMYLINMPLYVINELHLSAELAGTLMGTAAGLEIPIMLLGGYLTKYFSKKALIFTALGAGLLFYLGLLVFQNTWQLVLLQFFNAIFIGIIATLGMVYFQDLMPRQAGAATTLFSNAAKLSWVVAGPIAGWLAQFWHYSTVFYVSFLMIAIGWICLMKVKSVR
ncbi:MFS transporter [Lonepinella sp. BR2930]|uniref:MFS transporter n=1 Tax=unclassified Lonepinella TaxID=2642006 RepID=UPI003F6E0523